MVSLYSLLWVGLGWLGISMVNANYVEPYYALHGRLLKYFVIIFFVFFVSVILDHRRSEHQARNRFWLLSAGSLLLLVLLGWNQMKLRSDAWKPFGIHDGALHTEVAADFLLQGKNPYGADYSITPYKLLDPPIPGGPTDNIVWYHYMYPPAVAMTQAIVTFVAHRFGQPGDFRFVTILSLIVLWLMLIRQTSDYEKKTWHTLATLANPLIWIFVLPGHNDIVSVTALIGSCLLFSKKKFLYAGLLFGYALGLKQSMWISVPLVLIMLVRQWKLQELSLHNLCTYIFGVILSVIAIFLPFIIWSPFHIFNDLVRYASGSIPYAYAISGSTILQYLVTTGIVASPYSIIPTWFFQSLVGLPTLGLVGWWIWKRPTISQFFTSYALLTFVILMFSRYFNANYFSALFILFYASYALRGTERISTVSSTT